MRLFRLASCAFALTVHAGYMHGVHSQTIADWTSAAGPWDTPANWSTSLVPDSTYDEIANISNGGSAQVNSAISTFPGRIILGQQSGQSGNLTVGNGGQISALAVPGNVSQGEIFVGSSGAGLMTVQSGGSVGAQSINVGGEPGSRLTVGSTSAGIATVNVIGGTTISRGLKVVGPNANFVTGAMSFSPTGIYAPQITSSTSHSTIKVAAVLNIDNGATLRPEFTGVTPTTGSKWNLFDADAVFGQFQLDTSAAPALGYGQLYQFSVKSDPTSTNGFFGQLSVESRLVLDVNRNTGAMSINAGSVSGSLDGYTIRSPLGALKPSGWSSFQDQAISDWRESRLGGSANFLSELKPTGSTTISAGTGRSLGSAYQPIVPAAFGTPTEDIDFEYYSAGGVVTKGIINYIGQKKENNLVLVVDPSTGNARVQNESIFNVSIVGYRIDSASGSLKVANGQWNSLDDQNAGGGDWRESNSSANRLAELKPTASLALNGGSDAGFNLGSLFKTVGAGGTQDLTFQYLFNGESEFRTGVISYRSISPFLSADFNHDTLVNSADLTIWKTSFGAGAGADANGDGKTDGADFLAWQRQFGTTSSVAVAAAVPEPTSMLIACLGLTPGLLRRRASTCY